MCGSPLAVWKFNDIHDFDEFQILSHSLSLSLAAARRNPAGVLFGASARCS